MSSGMLTQEEIDALMTGDNQENKDQEEIEPKDDSKSDGSSVEENLSSPTEQLDPIEQDAIGEIGNISMGTAATTLFTLLNQRVQITTPEVMQSTIKEISQQYPLPFVVVQVGYRIGIEGTNLLILKEDDVKIITSLMLGGDGKTDLPEELTDIHLSAISEAMNQMIGSSSTSLSEMMGMVIDITPPIVSRVQFEDGSMKPDIISAEEEIICISFRMTIGDLIDSTIMQILPIPFAKNLVEKMIHGGEDSTKVNDSDSSQSQQPKEEVKATEQSNVPQNDSSASYIQEEQPMSNISSPHQMQGQQTKKDEQKVNIQQAAFSSFDEPASRAAPLPENIDLIKDVLLKVSVELGTTTRPIDDVLQFAPGSIIELDKLVGEPLNILVNGKPIAYGEVVVIDENYGVRVTDIVSSEKRLRDI